MKWKQRIWGIYGVAVGTVAALMAVGPWHVSGTGWAVYGVCVGAAAALLAVTMGGVEEGEGT